jgi:hypothetical protein
MAGADGMDGADADPADVVVLVWEAIAGTAIEMDLVTQVGSGSKTITELEMAIKATAMRFGVDYASAIKYLDDNYATYERVQATEVAAILMALHVGGHLAATMESAVVTIAGDGTAAVWESIAGAAIEMDLVTEVGPGSKTVTELETAIKVTAGKFGVDYASAIKYLDDNYATYERVQATEVAAILMALHVGGHLAATMESAVVTIAGDGTAAVWESIAGAAIEMDLVTEVGPGSKTVTELETAIKVTAGNK